MDEAAALRSQMVAKLARNAVTRRPQILRAMRDVPRHQFLPGVDVNVAYADQAVVVRRDVDGTAVSSASQPSMVALTLDQLDIGASARVLEVGTGTGYSAALLAALTGSSGLVVTIEIDETLAARAEEALRQWASTPVRVIFGDGRLGHPEYAPYDRIVVTAGVPAIAPAWSDQLTDGGCLVVPVVDHRGAGSLLTLRKIGGDLVQRAARPCRFVRLRSAAERPAT